MYAHTYISFSEICANKAYSCFVTDCPGAAFLLGYPSVWTLLIPSLATLAASCLLTHFSSFPPPSPAACSVLLMHLTHLSCWPRPPYLRIVHRQLHHRLSSILCFGLSWQLPSLQDGHIIQKHNRHNMWFIDLWRWNSIPISRLHVYPTYFNMRHSCLWNLIGISLQGASNSLSPKHLSSLGELFFPCCLSNKNTVLPKCRSWKLIDIKKESKDV